jgi:16S rRNA (cytosine967-C5)-methyltransferase
LQARRAAWRLLDAVTGEAMLLSDARAGGLLGGLPPEGRARAQRLAMATLRELSRADAALAPRLRKPPPLTVLNLLRLAAVELGAGEAPHGVVNAAVTLLAEGRTTQGHRGLANAVLRRLAEDGPEGWARLAPPRLPPWLRARLVAAWGEGATEAMEAAHARGAPIDLAAKGDGAALAAAVGGALLPTGAVRLPPGAQVTALPGWHEGAFWVQDAAAQLPVRVLGPQRGERVLDLCAAPGGKTMQLAARGAEVTAVDASAPRLQLLRDNLARTGLAARVVERDALEFAEKGWDAVLLDAPCSATGTIRRHPDLPVARSGEEVPSLLELQDRLLDHALGLLRPGGRLVFATCSLLPEEGEERLAALLARRPGLLVEPPEVPGLDPAWVAREALRTRPDGWAGLGGLDGFFVARLRVPG